MMQYERRVTDWWYEPELSVRRVRVSRTMRKMDPTLDEAVLPATKRLATGAFKPKRKWVSYNRLHGIDAGYMVPLFTLEAIGKRYGLSQTTQRYFRKHILPEPYDIVRRRSVSAHHWSKFTLMVLDVVLHDLEMRGRLEILRTYKDHVNLIHVGVQHLEDYYDRLDREDIVKTTDRFGVEWF